MKVIRKQPNSHDCIVCGVDNNLGINASFYETEDKQVVALFSFKQEHQSYPERTHGGMICSMLDELIGRAIWAYDPNMWGVTMNINVKYRKPVPLDTKLKGIGRIDSQTSRTFNGSGEILDQDGNILAEASAMYMKLPLEKIASTSVDGDVNVYVEDDVTEV